VARRTLPLQQTVQRAAAAVGASFSGDAREGFGQLVFARSACRRRAKPEPVQLPAGSAILKLTSGSTGLPRASRSAPAAGAAVQIMRTMVRSTT
jgi:hypothetical protein